MRPMNLCLLFVLAAACGGSDSKGDTSNAKTVDITRVDACDQEIALVCDEGMIDGCEVTDEGGTRLTLAHICVQASESSSQAPCEQEIARVCDDGFIDACLLTPAAASSHVCVLQPADDTSADPSPVPVKEVESEAVEGEEALPENGANSE